MKNVSTNVNESELFIQKSPWRSRPFCLRENIKYKKALFRPSYLKVHNQKMWRAMKISNQLSDSVIYKTNNCVSMLSKLIPLSSQNTNKSAIEFKQILSKYKHLTLRQKEQIIENNVTEHNSGVYEEKKLIVPKPFARHKSSITPNPFAKAHNLERDKRLEGLEYRSERRKNLVAKKIHNICKGEGVKVNNSALFLILKAKIINNDIILRRNSFMKDFVYNFTPKRFHLHSELIKPFFIRLKTLTTNYMW